MKAGVTVSMLAHVALLTGAIVSLASPRPLEVPDLEALPIDIIPIEELTKNIEGSREAEPAKVPAPEPTPEPPKPEPDPAENVGDTQSDVKAEAPEKAPEPPVEKIEAPTPQPRPVEPEKPEPVAEKPKPEEPTPVPTPELKPDPEPKTEVAEKPEETPVEEVEKPAEEAFQKLPTKVSAPKRRPQAAKPKQAQTNKRKIEDLIKTEATKSETKEPAKEAKPQKLALLNKEKPSKGGKKKSTKKAALGTKSGKDVKLAQSELDALRTFISNCWNAGALPGSEFADQLRATATFTIDASATLVGKPDVKATGGDNRANRTMAGSISRAIRRCKEFPMLKNKYDTGEELEVRFTLGDML